MIRNYFKIAWRKLIKNKGYTVINVGGLAIGLAVVMLIGLWVYDEISFNKYHSNYDRIGRLMVHNGSGTYKTHPIPLATELTTFFGSDLKSVVPSTQPQSYTIGLGDKIVKDAGVFMHPDGPEMFTLRMLQGSWAGLKSPNSIFLSRSLTKKLFGDEDPVNKSIQIDGKIDVTVTGIYEDFPKNSEFNEIMFISAWDVFITYNDGAKNSVNDWADNFIHIFAEINPATDFDKISAKVKDIKISHISKEKAEANKPELFLHPMRKWHLYSKFENRANVTSEQFQFVWFYSLIGIFVLFLACINFMNLSTARSEKRSKEVGIRKVVGSARGQLINQFYSESVLVAILAFAFSILLVYLILPWFNSVADKDVSILWNSSLFWVAGVIFAVFTGLLAGSYPALYLSSFQPAAVLKGGFSGKASASLPRKVLVVFQFTVSIALIIGTITVYRQIQFAKNRPIGYSPEGLIMIHIKAKDLNDKYEVLSQELKKTGAVTAVGAASSTITNIASMSSGFDWKGKDPAMESSLAVICITPEYGSTVNWKFTAGRDFNRDMASDSTGLIINEAAARYMSIINPIDEIIRWETDDFKGGQFKVLGVVEDILMRSPFEPAYPTVFFLQGNKNWIYARINPETSVHEGLPKIERVMKTINPSAAFEYRLVDEQYALKFASEVRIGKLAGFFAILAIFISCLGLFGLASFIAEQRMKEISIRKVMGASVPDLWRLLSKDFLILVVCSCFIAIPVAYYLISEWLQKYEYRTELSWWIFVFAGGSALFIALLTISFQIIKASIINPIKSLRSE